MPLTAEDVNQANLARLRQLAGDATRKRDDAHELTAQRIGLGLDFKEPMLDRSYWDGMKAGLERAIRVLEGQG